MEHWNVVKCRSDVANFFLLNKTKTLIRVSGRVGIDIAEFLAALEDVGFPLKFTEGLSLVNFTIIPGGKYYGHYWGDVVTIDSRKKRRMRTLVETFVHEVAHHIDSEDDFSELLTRERKKKGHLLHKRAKGSDSEYWARGFERFYSVDPDDKRALRQTCPKLYRMILRLHKEFSHR